MHDRTDYKYGWQIDQEVDRGDFGQAGMYSVLETSAPRVLFLHFLSLFLPCLSLSVICAHACLGTLSSFLSHSYFLTYQY